MLFPSRRIESLAIDNFNIKNRMFYLFFFNINSLAEISPTFPYRYIAPYSIHSATYFAFTRCDIYVNQYS